jgi:hypothetical protein
VGNLYTNVTTRGPVQQELAELLRHLGRRAFVTPTTNGFSVTCDRECENQNTDLLSSLAMTVSTELKCPAWAVLNHDDDVLWYQLFENGTLVDAYISDEKWWEAADEPAPRGEAEVLCQSMGAPGAKKEVKRILARRGGVLGYQFEVQRHAALLEALGQPGYAAGFGYKYASRGELPAGISREQMLHL